MIITVKTRSRPFSGTIGLIVRSTGYLQGGYRGGTQYSQIQRFNTTSEVGSVVTDTNYTRLYTPGLSGDLVGYYSINNNTDYNKFNYTTFTSSASFGLSDVFPRTTAYDFGLSTESWILTGTASATWTGAADVTNWVKLNLGTETPSYEGNISDLPLSTTRQAVNNARCASFLTNLNTLIVLDYTTKTTTISPSHPSANVSTLQIPCGMAKDISTSYFVGYTTNLKLSFLGSTINSIITSTPYGYNFGESHSVTSDSSGFMMAGYYDTSGRYGGAQHGLCQKISFATETITSMPDLAIAQSSGQMMQGF